MWLMISVLFVREFLIFNLLLHDLFEYFFMKFFPNHISATKFINRIGLWTIRRWAKCEIITKNKFWDKIYSHSEAY